LEQENENIKRKLLEENERREEETKELQKKIDKEKEEIRQKLNSVNADLQQQIENETQGIEGKLVLDSEQLKAENAKLLEKLEKEKMDLQTKLHADSSELERKLAKEAEKYEREKNELERKLNEEQAKLEEKLEADAKEKIRQQQELEEKLTRNEEEKNEILQLYEKMRRENEARKKENEDLRNLLDQDKEDLFLSFSRGTSEVRDLLEKEKANLTKKIEHQNKTAALLEKELERNKEDDEANRKDVEQLRSVITELYSAVAQSCSIYFNAIREDAYMTGGEEYLTFSSCTVNAGNHMDAQSGIFITPITGCYMFTVHVCTADMKKVLLSLRRNGVEVATVYDQNHIDNHKNSMAGQSVLIELAAGDRIQLYLYTFSGLQDKPGNHLTQFLGVLLRPLEVLPESSIQKEKPKKRVIMSLE